MRTRKYTTKGYYILIYSYLHISAQNAYYTKDNYILMYSFTYFQLCPDARGAAERATICISGITAGRVVNSD